MPSKHPRIAVTADAELGLALERVRAATGTREADATLVRRLAVGGAEAELRAGHDRRSAAAALLGAMDGGGFDLDPRGADGISAVDRTLEGLREIAVDRAVQRGVLAAMRQLADGGSHGAHRLPLADLTVAVAAQSAGLDVLHFDRHFERLGALLGTGTSWIAKPST